MSSDRRGNARAPVSATVVLSRGGENLGRFRALNVSAGGVLVAGRPPLAVGEEVVASVRFSADSYVRVAAVVLRSEATGEGGHCALAFVRLSPDIEDVIQAAVLAGLEEARQASVLVVDESPAICSALQRDLGQLGRQSFAVSTSLDAVRFLEQPNRVSAVLVDVLLNLAEGRDVLAYLTEEHPQIRRVLMCGPVLRGHPAPCPAHPFAQQVLAKPWTGEALARALSLSIASA